MQDRERILKELDTLKMQLSFADISALTAPEAEKERWEQKRSDLQSRITELQKDLDENVVYDGENAAPIIDDATADAMLEQILAAGEPEEQTAPAPDLSAESADEVVHNDPDNIIIDLPGKTVEKEEAYQPDDASVQAMIDEILMAGDHSEYVVAQHEKAEQEEDPASEPVIVAQPPQEEEKLDEQPEEPIMSPWQPEDDRSEAMLKEILAATAERDKNQEPIAPVVPENQFAAERPFVTTAKPRTAERTIEPIAVDMSVPLLADDFADRLDALRNASVSDTDLLLQIERLKLELEDAYRRAQMMMIEAERVKSEAAHIKLSAETERAMYAAEMELQRGLRNQEDQLRREAERAEKDRIAEKIARRKAEITEIRNGLQDVKDSESAFALREKLFSVQLVLDDDERNSPEISYLLTKSLDDLTHLLEVSDLKRRIAAMVSVSKKQSAKAAAAKKKTQAKKAEAKKAAAKKAAAAAKKKKAAAAKKRLMMRMMAARRTPRH